MLTHYPNFIREFSCTDGFDTEHSEAAYSYLVKQPYAQTNKRSNYENQILYFNTRRLNIIVRNDTIMYQHTEPISNVDKQEDMQVTKPVAAMDLDAIGWKSGPRERQTIKDYAL